jgi:hypothetical protein
MLTLLPGPLVLLISAGLTILFTALCASLILLVSLAKLLLPVRPLAVPAAASTTVSCACGWLQRPGDPPHYPHRLAD